MLLQRWWKLFRTMKCLGLSKWFYPFFWYSTDDTETIFSIRYRMNVRGTKHIFIYDFKCVLQSMDMGIHPFLYFVMKIIPKTRIKSVECERQKRATVYIWLCKWTFTKLNKFVWCIFTGIPPQTMNECNTNPIEYKMPARNQTIHDWEKGCKMNYLCTIFIYWNNAFGTCTTHSLFCFRLYLILHICNFTLLCFFYCNWT